MGRGALALAAAAAAGLIAVSATSAQGPVTAEVSLSADRLVIGDVVRVTASVRHPAGHGVGPLELGETWGPLEVRGPAGASTVDNGDGTETTTIAFDTQVFELGELLTPALRIAVTSPTGSRTDAVAAPASFEVVSVLRDSELRDIRPQARMPGPRTGLIIAIALGSAAAAVALVLAARLAIARLRTPSAVPEPDPYERARAELAEIEAMGLIEKGRVAEHYALISGALRRYLEAGLGVEAVDATTSEISRRVREGGLPWRLGHRALGILSAADLVKFARHRPGGDEARALGADAAGLIDDLNALGAGA